MFGKESKACKVYEFGCLKPNGDINAFENQIYKKNQLWNKLVEIEREYRQAVRELITPSDNHIDTLKSELESIRAEIKAKRKAARKSVDISDLKTKADKLKEELKTAIEVNKVNKKAIIEANKEKINLLDQKRKEQVKQISSESDLYWLNKEDVLASYDTARKRAMREGVDLRFHRFDGSGKCFVRWQTGLSLDKLFGVDTLLQIAPVAPEAWYSPIRSERRKASRTTVKFRVCSDNKRPVWLELPMVMHREISKNGQIRNASLIRTKVGKELIYKLIVTVAFDELPKTNLNQHGAVGIDIGWRRVNDGIRVAYCVDSEGQSEELILPDRIISQFLKLNDLKSIRDQHFNDCKTMLSTWMKDKHVPEWLKEATQYLHQWKAKLKLIDLYKKWKDERFSGDQEVFAYLHEYSKREDHLFLWESNLRDQVQKARLHFYRNFAAKLASTYKTIKMEKINLRGLVEKKKPEEGTQGTLPQNAYRFIASVSLLRQTIENACRSAGTDVEYYESKDTTKICNVCKHKESFSASNQIYWTCSKCGTLHDQDENAAQNILSQEPE